MYHRMNNDERDKSLYRYPYSDVLRNKLCITDALKLDLNEMQIVTIRAENNVPSGEFNLAHLQSIHYHLFQDVYKWAGEIRQTDISKGGHWFHPYNRIEMAMEDVHKRLKKERFLHGLGRAEFANRAAEYIGDVNRIHPFREGNGRTQFQYLKQLGEKAGHFIDLTRFERNSWILASQETFNFKHERMAACINTATVSPDRNPVKTRDDSIREREQRLRQQKSAQQNQRNDRGRDR